MLFPREYNKMKIYIYIENIENMPAGRNRRDEGERKKGETKGDEIGGRKKKNRREGRKGGLLLDPPGSGLNFN